jgi:hypothetical protein
MKAIVRPEDGYASNIGRVHLDYGLLFSIFSDGQRYRARRKVAHKTPRGPEVIGQTLDELADGMDERLAAEAAGDQVAGLDPPS